MADVLELELTDQSENELGAHQLSLRDAIEVLDEDDYRTFPDPTHAPRRYMIGRTRSGRLLTLIIEAIDDSGRCLLITGWSSSQAEITLYSRSGGSKYAGRPANPSDR